MNGARATERQQGEFGGIETALAEMIGKPLGMTVREAAAGIRRIVDLRMADEVKVIGAKRGVDPSEFTLLPFGGAGAVHAPLHGGGERHHAAVGLHQDPCWSIISVI